MVAELGKFTATRLQGRGRGKQGKRKRTDVAASTWIQEDGDVPIDFMSADAAHSVLTVSAPPSKRIRGTQVGNAGAENKARHMSLLNSESRLCLRLNDFMCRWCKYSWWPCFV
eukprot:s5_g18.t1